MLLEILASVCSVGVVFFLIELVVTIIRNKSAHQFFKKRSPNLPVLPNPGLIGGHMNQVIWTKRAWKQLREYHGIYGKTFGFYYGPHPHVDTVDLDLIRAMVIENPHDNTDRFAPQTPLEEFERDSLLTSYKKQWSRVRNAFAPAFT